MGQNIIMFLILNLNTGADKHNQQIYNTADEIVGQKLPVTAIYFPKKNKIKYMEACKRDNLEAKL
jgi:hypothetical protein